MYKHETTYEPLILISPKQGETFKLSENKSTNQISKIQSNLINVCNPSCTALKFLVPCDSGTALLRQDFRCCGLFSVFTFLLWWNNFAPSSLFIH